MKTADQERAVRRWGLDPVTRKRFLRFREMRRAWWAFWILLILYGVSLVSELVAGNQPLWVRFRGHLYFPIFRFYPEDVFTGSGRMTRPDYKQVARSETFRADPRHRMVFPPIPYGPLETVRPESITLPDEALITLSREPVVGTVTLTSDGSIVSTEAVSFFFGVPEERLAGQPFEQFIALPVRFKNGLEERFANRAAPALVVEIHGPDGQAALLSLATFASRTIPPASIRLLLREPEAAAPVADNVSVFREGDVISVQGATWRALGEGERARLLEAARKRFEEPVADERLLVDGRWVRARFSRDVVTFPLRPVQGHPFGLDSAGRDVLVRILYGLRTSLTFGLLLVVVTMMAGIAMGALQGYYGGLVDLLGQRAVEIWESLPFLYILILMGSVFGRSFSLLLICYGIFNWVGISYYIRAEFLRLRKLPFVEAAWCMGLPARKIIFRHILPNALVPVITFFPFSLVGAIGVLAALDYLGFGLPPPTASWGEMLAQAQEYNWAWWLSLYPSLALFLVMLLGVFIGEGVRAAFDPRRYTRLE
jgi:microcin C transport system permease protein